MSQMQNSVSLKDKIGELEAKEVKEDFNGESDKKEQHDVDQSVVEVVEENVGYKNLDEDLEEIERESNEMMEVFLQFMDVGRKKKLEVAEAKRQQTIDEVKQRKAEDAARHEEEKVAELGAIKEPEGQTWYPHLNHKEKILLEELFQDKPGRFTIKGEKVRNLIENKLQGRVVGDGNGSQMKILWGNDQVGMYEVDRAPGGRGYLKSGWVVRVADALREAERRGYISAGVLSVVGSSTTV